MSSLMYRWGRLAARRPWRVIVAWLVVSVLLVAAAAGFGKQLEDSFVVPGLDSQQAVELQQAAQSDRAGLTAQVVVSPLDGRAHLADAGPERSDLAALEESVATLPNVVDTNTSISPDGTVASIRVQYPVVEELDPVDLENLKALADDARAWLDLADRDQR